MKHNRTWLAVILITLLALPAFATGQGEAATEQAVEFNPSGYPVVDEKITLEYFAERIPFHGDFDEMPVLQAYEEETNIHIDWSLSPRGGIREKVNLLFASGGLPDAFYGRNTLTSTDIMRYRDELVSLNGLIENYAPNLQQILEKNPGVEPEITTSDGNIYSLFSLINWGVAGRVQGRWFINQEWLDALDLEMPTTTAELVEVLRAFRDEDPNGNGAQDEIPFSTRPAYYEEFKIFGSFGVVDPIMVDDGEASLGAMAPEYREALKFYADLYEEGLVDEEFFVHDRATFFGKISSDPPTVGLWYGHIVDNANENLGIYEAMPPVTAPSGEPKHAVWPSVPPRKNRFTITSANPYPEIAMRWIDLSYDREWSIAMNMGERGVRWDYNDEGKVVKFEPPEGVGDGEWRHRQTPGGISVFIWGIEGFEFVRDEQNLRLNRHSEPFLEYSTEEKFPDLPYYTPEDAERLSFLTSTIDTYVQEMMAAFISGNSDIDAEWDDYISTLENMGAAELEDIYTATYQAFAGN